MEAHPAWSGGKHGGRGGAVLGQGPQRSRAPHILLEPLWVPLSSQLSLQADLWGPHHQALALHLPIRVWALGALAGDWKDGRGGGQSIYFLGSFLMGSFRLALSLPCMLLLLPEQFLSLWVQVAAPFPRSVGPGRDDGCSAISSRDRAVLPGCLPLELDVQSTWTGWRELGDTPPGTAVCRPLLLWKVRLAQLEQQYISKG